MGMKFSPTDLCKEEHYNFMDTYGVAGIRRAPSYECHGPTTVHGEGFPDRLHGSGA